MTSGNFFNQYQNQGFIKCISFIQLIVMFVFIMNYAKTPGIIMTYD